MFIVDLYLGNLPQALDVHQKASLVSLFERQNEGRSYPVLLAGLGVAGFQKEYVATSRRGSGVCWEEASGQKIELTGCCCCCFIKSQVWLKSVGGFCVTFCHILSSLYVEGCCAAPRKTSSLVPFLLLTIPKKKNLYRSGRVRTRGVT